MAVTVMLAIAATAAWSLPMVLVKRALRDMDAIAYGLLCPAVALCCVTVTGLLTSSLTFSSAAVAGLAALGGVLDLLCGAALYMFAVKRITAHEAGALANTVPLWALLAAILWLGEAVTVVKVLGAVLVVLGAYYLGGTGRFNLRNTSRIGSLAAVGSGFLAAVGDVAISKYCLLRGMSAPAVLLAFLGGGCVGWLIVAGVTGRFSRRFYPRPGVGIALFAGVTNMFGGMMLWYMALGRAQASVLAPIRGALTFFMFLFSIVFLRERPSLRSAGGVLLVGGGVVLASFLA